jgi:hypothetical protein
MKKDEEDDTEIDRCCIDEDGPMKLKCLGGVGGRAQCVAQLPEVWPYALSACDQPVQASRK